MPRASRGLLRFRRRRPSAKDSGGSQKKHLDACRRRLTSPRAAASDPPGLPFGYEHVENFDSPSIFAAYRRYEMIVDSPYNGFQLDLGVLAEGSVDANTQIPPLVRYLAERARSIRFTCARSRAVSTTLQKSIPMRGCSICSRITRILRDAGYPGGILPDHMPSHSGDPGKLQAFAFGYGYIHALINGVNSEVS